MLDLYQAQILTVLKTAFANGDEVTQSPQLRTAACQVLHIAIHGSL